MLLSMGLQRIRHNLATEQQNEILHKMMTNKKGSGLPLPKTQTLNELTDGPEAPQPQSTSGARMDGAPWCSAGQ